MVPGERTSGAIGPVKPGRETDDEAGGPSLTEWGNRGAKVVGMPLPDLIQMSGQAGAGLAPGIEGLL